MLFANNIVALQREIEQDRNQVRQLEQQREDLKRTQMAKSDRKSQRMRELADHPDAVNLMRQLEREMQIDVGFFLNRLTEMNREIRNLEQRINEKNEECHRLMSQ